jgi:hypothetical protein
MIGGRVPAWLRPGRPVLASAVVLAALAAASGPGLVNAETGDGAEGFVPVFEERSNRLSPFDAARLDRLAGRMILSPGYHLVLLAPAGLDPAARHFTAARLAVLRQELSRRGLVAQVSYGPAGLDPDAAIALRLVADPPPSSPAPPPSSSAELPAPSSGPPSAPVVVAEAPPVPLLPPSVPAAEVPPPVPAAPPSPEPASDPVPAVAVEDTWTAAVGETLQSVLRSWGDHAGWTLVWQSDRDYPVDAQATFSGDFTTAASQLLDGFATAVPAPYAHLYRGNHVILVQSGEGR